MKKSLYAFLFAILLIPAIASPARAQIDQQQTINSAAATVERIKTSQAFGPDFNARLPKARAVLVIPSFYKGGFILGAQYGNGVLVARQPSGGFGEPAFYNVSGGSIGFQIGLQDISVILLIMTDRGYDQLLANKFVVGAQVGLTFGVVGIGGGVGTTPAVDSDIVTYQLGAVGLYAGANPIDGAAVTARDSWNSAYYGRDLNPADILNNNAANNQGADRLREMLGH